MARWNIKNVSIAGVSAVVPKKTVKTDKQIVKWLSSDNGDSAKYKMWGNGVALPNVIFVLSGIAALNFLEEQK